MKTIFELNLNDLVLPEVREVSLLTYDEWNENCDNIPEPVPSAYYEAMMPPEYYLMTPGYSNTEIMCVNYAGNEENVTDVDYQDYVDFDNLWEYGTGTRPAIKFAEPIKDAKIGDKIWIGDSSLTNGASSFTVIAPDIILLDFYISHDIFSKNNNNYKTSNVKKIVDEWYEKDIKFWIERNKK